MSDPTASSLAFLWTRRRRLRRLLFFTYRFNFRWFHNEVLGFIRRSSLANTDVLVFATRFDDDAYAGGSQASGDLYSLDEWAKWKVNLRIRYLPANRFLFHNKFIVAEYEKPGVRGASDIVIGLGSSNLTWGGWQRNLELWTWDAGESLSACASFLEFLGGMPNVGAGVVESWLKGMHRYRKRSVSIPWLFGDDKTSNRNTAFKSLVMGIKDKPRVLRIMSPYFDEGSVGLMEELLSVLNSAKGGVDRVEVWVDGSQVFAKPLDYRNLIGLQVAQKGELLIKSIRKKPGNGFQLPEQVHAKVIELESQNGSVSRLLGSANFTAAAWCKSRNTETIFHEITSSGLPQLLDDSVEVVPVSSAKLEKWATDQGETESELKGVERWIYWAAFDETASPYKLTVSYSSKEEPIRLRVLAAFDPRHTKLPLQSRSIIETFENSRNWTTPNFLNGLVEIHLKEAVNRFPERLRVALDFADGESIESAVEVADPDFALRDLTTGIPFEPSNENLLGLGKTIVDPLPKRSTSEESDYEISGEEEDVIEPPMVPDSLSDDPDFDREPQGVQFARTLAKADGQELTVLRKRVRAFRLQAQDPAQILLLDALSGAMKEMPK
ncbi:MAG: hypothetical protein LAO08_05595 [Acidobacteriia bacterium]|nr:hypothetical protein [Terriglobia bacterium]